MFRLCISQLSRAQIKLAKQFRPFSSVEESILRTRNGLLIAGAPSISDKIHLQPLRSNIRSLSAAVEELVFDDQDDDVKFTKSRSSKSLISSIENRFNRFEQRAQATERVTEHDFAKMFNSFTLGVEKLKANNMLDDDCQADLAIISCTLLRCCGKLMFNSEPKTRELLAGNVWTFLKESKLTTDISHYNCLLRVMNENNTNFDPKKILQEIIDLNLKPDRVTYQRLIHQYCLQGNVGEAQNLLEKMKELNMMLNESTFASLIIGYSRQGTSPGLDELLELMKANNVEITGITVTAIITSTAEKLKKDPSASTDDLLKVKELIEQDDIIFHGLELADMIECLTELQDKNQSIKEIFEIVCSSQLKTSSMRYRVIGSLIKNKQLEKASELYWANKPSQKRIETGTAGGVYIKTLAMNSNIEFALQECAKLRDRKHNLNPFHILYQHAAEEGNLPMIRAVITKLAEETTIKCHFYWPLLAQARNEQEMIDVLKNDMKNFSAEDMTDTFHQWIWPKYETDIRRLFEINKEQLGYGSEILLMSLFNYFMANDKLSDAIKFISDAPEDLLRKNNSPVEVKDQEEFLENDRNQRRRGLGSLSRILNQLVEETKDPILAKKVFELCNIQTNAPTRSDLDPLVRAYLYNNDHQGAIETFLEIGSRYNLTPCKRELTTKCLEEKDAENLQKIMNVSNRIYGESNSLFDLADVCLSMNKVKQAQKIFASPGFRVSPERVYRACRIFASKGNMDALENLVHLSLDCHDVDQDYLYQLLIEAYDKNSCGGRALDLWNRMQEEQFRPSKRSLLMIAQVLEKNNIDLPFKKPSSSDSGDRRRVDKEREEQLGLDGY